MQTLRRMEDGPQRSQRVCQSPTLCLSPLPRATSPPAPTRAGIPHSGTESAQARLPCRNAKAAQPRQGLGPRLLRLPQSPSRNPSEPLGCTPLRGSMRRHPPAQPLSVSLWPPAYPGCQQWWWNPQGCSKGILLDPRGFVLR